MTEKVGTPKAVDEAAEFERELILASAAAIRLAISLGRSTEDSAEVVQEAAMQAWRYRSTRRGEWQPWFLSIVYRIARRRTPHWLPLPVGWDRPGDSWPGQLRHDPNLEVALSQLPSRQRAAMLLRYSEDMSVEAVAHVMGLSEGATKQLLARARDGLRNRYEVLEARG